MMKSASLESLQYRVLELKPYLSAKEFGKYIEGIVHVSPSALLLLF